MKVTQEAVTVFADPIARVVNVLFAGLRITLTPDECSLLTRGLIRSTEQLRGASQKTEVSAAADAYTVAGDADCPPNTRTVVDEIMRDKMFSPAPWR